MDSAEPFIFRFKKACISPRRQPENPNLRYDSQADMTFVKVEDRYVLAIDSAPTLGLGTKKADIEKGEDQKDSLMW